MAQSPSRKTKNPKHMAAANEKSTVIVHGVQLGDNTDAVEGPNRLERLMKELVARSGQSLTFKALKPVYEEFTDRRGKPVREISKILLGAKLTPLATDVLDRLFDLIGDVFIYNYSESGKEIRRIVADKIAEAPNCVLVAHSLGSVVALDAVCDLMRGGEFADKPAADWPVRSLVTFGSPLALKMFRRTRNLPGLGTARSTAGPGQDRADAFHWFNYSDRDDPIVSGSVFGKQYENDDILADVYREAEPLGWHIHDRVINTGFHIQAHVSYWGHEAIARRVLEQLAIS